METSKSKQPGIAPVKVMFIDHTARLSGGEIALLRLISALDRSEFAVSLVLFSSGEIVPELRKLDIEPVILPLHKDVLDTRKESITPSLFLRPRHLLRAFRHVFAVKALIDREKPDLVHTNSLKADIIGGIAARLAGVPVIWHIRDRICPEYLPPFAVRLFRFLARIIPDYIVANSRATMATLHLPEHMERAAVVYSGLGPEAEPAREKGSPARQATVLYDGIAEQEMRSNERAHHSDKVGLIGRISPWKGQREFIDAAAIVLKEKPDTQFEIVGSPMFGEDEYLAGLVKQIDSLGLGHAVRLAGFSHDIPDVLSRLSIFVHASVLPEPFGQTVLEAMAAGVPTIATNAGAIPEIVSHELTGLLVPPGDAPAMAKAILRLLDDRTFARGMAVRAQRVAYERFNIVQAAERMQGIYRQLLGLGTD